MLSLHHCLTTFRKEASRSWKGQGVGASPIAQRNSAQKPHSVGRMISNPQENSEITNLSCVESESMLSLLEQQQGTNTCWEEKMPIRQEQDVGTCAEEFPPGPFLFRSPVYTLQRVLWSWHSWTRTCLTFDLGFTFSSPQCLWHLVKIISKGHQQAPHYLLWPRLLLRNNGGGSPCLKL